MDGGGVLTWSTAVPDWEDRIRGGRSLLPDLPLNDAVAEKALRVFKRLRLPDVSGNPTYGEACDEWVFGIVRAIFGSYDPATRRRAIREFFLLVPKGNAKTAIAAAIMLTAIIVNDRPRAEGILIAPRIKVADLSFQHISGMIALDPDLSTLFHLQEHLRKITHRMTKAFLQIKAADKEVVTGSKAAFILVDETHELAGNSKAPAIMVELRGSLGKRPDGFLVQITTQSKTPPSGVFKQELDTARDVRDGKIDLPLLPVLYEFPVAMMVGEEWRDTSTWGLVNPNLGRSLDLRFLQDEFLKADRDGPHQMALFASQHLNVQVGLGLHADRWPGALFWQAAAIGRPYTLADLKDECEVAVVGVDGGGLDDLAAIVVAGRVKGTREWRHWAHAWAQPEVFERRKDIAQQLHDFVADGDLTICESADEDAVAMAEICATLHAAGLLPEKAAIGLDAYGVATLVDELAARGIADPMVVAVGQGWKLQQAVLTLPRKLKDGTFKHAGQGLMAFAVGNAKQELRGSNYVVTKQAAGSAKIDPLMATFNAAMLMFANPVAASGSSYLEAADLVIV